MQEDTSIRFVKRYIQIRYLSLPLLVIASVVVGALFVEVGLVLHFYFGL